MVGGAPELSADSRQAATCDADGMSDQAPLPLPPESIGEAPGRDLLRSRRVVVVGAGALAVIGGRSRLR